MFLNRTVFIWRSYLLCLLAALIITDRAEAVRLTGSAFPWQKEFELKSGDKYYCLQFFSPLLFQQSGIISTTISETTTIENQELSDTHIIELNMGPGLGISDTSEFSISPGEQYDEQHQPLIFLGAVGLALLFMNQPVLTNDVRTGKRANPYLSNEKLFAQQCQFSIHSPQTLTLSVPSAIQAATQGAAQEQKATKVEITLSSESGNMHVQFTVHFLRVAQTGQHEWRTHVFTMPVSATTPLLTQEFLSGAFFNTKKRPDQEQQEEVVVEYPFTDKDKPGRKDDDDEDEGAAGAAGTGCSSCLTSLCSFICRSRAAGHQQKGDTESQKSSGSGDKENVLRPLELIAEGRVTNQFNEILQHGINLWSTKTAQPVW